MKRSKLEEHYDKVMEENQFIPIPCTECGGCFNEVGDCWKLSPSVGEGYYWVYTQNDLFDIKIHDFWFHEDFFMNYESPEVLSITRYDSISGEELTPYRRMTAGCIKTFVGGYKPFKALVHKRVPIKSIGIEVTPLYYEDYLKQRYPGNYEHPLEAFRKIDQTMEFPAMSRLLHEVQTYRGRGIAADLYYEGKVAEAVSLVLEEQMRLDQKKVKPLTDADSARLDTVIAFLNDHYAFEVPLDQLAKIACMGTTKLKTSFKQKTGCTVTEYIQHRRMSQAEHLLLHTDFTIGQIAEMVGYSTSSRFAELFRKSTGVLPGAYRKLTRKGE